MKTLSERLFPLFFQAPHTKALLVFERNNYVGVIFQKDLEFQQREGPAQMEELTMFIPEVDLDRALFHQTPNDTTRIPVVNRTGDLVRMISFPEYQQHMHPQDMRPPAFDALLEHLDTPTFVCNHFKRLLFVNHEARALFPQAKRGENLAEVFRETQIDMIGQEMTLKYQDAAYRLRIHASVSEMWSFFLYQLTALRP